MTMAMPATLARLDASLDSRALGGLRALPSLTIPPPAHQPRMRELLADADAVFIVCGTQESMRIRGLRNFFTSRAIRVWTNPRRSAGSGPHEISAGMALFTFGENIGTDFSRAASRLSLDPTRQPMSWSSGKRRRGRR